MYIQDKTRFLYEISGSFNALMRRHVRTRITFIMSVHFPGAKHRSGTTRATATSAPTIWPRSAMRSANSSSSRSTAVWPPRRAAAEREADSALYRKSNSHDIYWTMDTHSDSQTTQWCPPPKDRNSKCITDTEVLLIADLGK